MYDDYFTVDLLSNASMDIFPDNKLNSFKTLLPKTITLEGDWRVGLVDVSFPTRTFNISRQKILVEKTHKSQSNVPIKLIKTVYRGHYTSIKSIVKHVNTRFANTRTGQGRIPVNDIIMVSFSRVTQTVLLTLSPHHKITFENPEIPEILGFGSGRLSFSNDTDEPLILKSDYSADAFRGYHTMIVESNLVQHGIVGNKMVPILRRFPVKHNEDIASGVSSSNSVSHFSTSPINHLIFDVPLMKKLKTTSFHTIEINLRDELGRLVNFTDVGRTTLTLLFNKRT
jgi:hypothetical protein